MKLTINASLRAIQLACHGDPKYEAMQHVLVVPPERRHGLTPLDPFVETGCVMATNGTIAVVRQLEPGQFDGNVPALVRFEGKKGKPDDEWVVILPERGMPVAVNGTKGSTLTVHRSRLDRSDFPNVVAAMGALPGPKDWGMIHGEDNKLALDPFHLHDLIMSMGLVRLSTEDRKYNRDHGVVFYSGGYLMPVWVRIDGCVDVYGVVMPRRID